MVKPGDSGNCLYCGTPLTLYSKVIHDHWLECKRVRLKAHDEATIDGVLYARDYWEELDEKGNPVTDQWPVLCDDGEVAMQPLFGNNKILQYRMPLATPEQEELEYTAWLAAADQQKMAWQDEIQPKTDEFITLLEQAGFQNISTGWGVGWTDWGPKERYHIRADMPRKFISKGQRLIRRRTKGKKYVRVTYTFYGGRWQGQWGARSPRTILREIAAATV